MQPSFGPKIVPASFPGTDQQQMMGIERQRALAQALMSQSMSPLETPQSGGRIASPVSPLAGVAKALQAVAGVYGQKKADERTAGLVEALRGRQNAALQRIADGPQVNAPGGVTQPEIPPVAAPAVPGDITGGAQPSPEVKPLSPPEVIGKPLAESVPNDLATALHTPGAIEPNIPTFEAPATGPVDVGRAPDVGITGRKQRQESATEFAMRVRIIANQLNLDPSTIMAMPEVGGKYAQLLEMEKEGRGFGRDMEKLGAQNELAYELERRKRGLSGGDIKFHVTGPDGTTYGVTQDKQIVPLPSAGADMNKVLIPDGKGGWIVNEQFVQAQGDIAAKRSVNVNNYPNPIPVTDPVTGETKMVQFGNKGEMREIPYGPPEQTKPTDAERLGKGYHDRMQAAESILNKVGEKGFPTVGTAVAGSLPMVGAYAERNAMTPAQQQYRQAQEDWVRAKLRKESGAVIGDEEMAREIRTYFPQPGDSPEVIQQKGESRAIAIQAMRDAAGPAIPRAPRAASGGGIPAGWHEEELK